MKKAIFSILLILALVLSCGFACSESPSNAGKYDDRFVVQIINNKDCGKVKGVNEYARYEDGTVLQISVTPKLGYKIYSVSWNNESVEFENPHELSFSKTVSKDSTLKVVYARGYYQAFVINDNEKGTLTGIENGGSYQGGALFSLNAVAKENYVISEVLVNNQPYTVSDFKNFTFQVAINSTTTIEVKYAYNLRKVTIENDNAKGEIVGVENGKEYEKGTSKAIYITPTEAYEIESISFGGVLEELTDAQKTGWYGVKEIFEDTTITVTYKQIKTKVTVENDNAKGGVTGVENGQLFEFGADAEISVMSNPGYIISSIKWNGVAEVINYDQQKYGYTFIATINENSTLEVTYSPLKKQVIVTNDDSKGTISGVTSGAEYGIKEGLEITITPNAEYVIKSVRWNGVEKVLSQTEKIEEYSFYGMVGETNTLVVEYAVKNLTVTVDNDASKGEITGVTNGQTFINGQDAEINIKAKPGYIISSIKWNGIAELFNYDQQKQGYTFIVIVEKDSTLEVTYSPLTKQVVVTNNLEQGVVIGVENSTEYGINERLTITITPNAEYIIKSVKWNGNEKTLTETEKSNGVIIEEIVGETNALVVEYELK